MPTVAIDADTRPVTRISRATHDLTQRARAGPRLADLTALLEQAPRIVP